MVAGSLMISSKVGSAENSMRYRYRYALEEFCNKTKDGNGTANVRMGELGFGKKFSQ